MILKICICYFLLLFSVVVADENLIYNSSLSVYENAISFGTSLNPFRQKRSMNDWFQIKSSDIIFKADHFKSQHVSPFVNLFPLDFEDYLAGIQRSVELGLKLVAGKLTREDVSLYGGVIMQHFLNPVVEKNASDVCDQNSYFYDLIDISAYSANLITSTIATLKKIESSSKAKEHAEGFSEKFIDYMRNSFFPINCTKSNEMIRTTYLLKMLQTCIKEKNAQTSYLKNYTIEDEITQEAKNLVNKKYYDVYQVKNDTFSDDNSTITAASLLGTVITAGGDWYYNLIIYAASTELDESRRETALLAHKLYFSSFLDLATLIIDKTPINVTAAQKEKVIIKMIYPLFSGFQFSVNLVAFFNQRSVKAQNEVVASFITLLRDGYDLYQVVNPPGSDPTQLILAAAKVLSIESTNLFEQDQSAKILSILNDVYLMLIKLKKIL